MSVNFEIVVIYLFTIGEEKVYSLGANNYSNQIYR